MSKYRLDRLYTIKGLNFSRRQQNGFELTINSRQFLAIVFHKLFLAEVAFNQVDFAHKVHIRFGRIVINWTSFRNCLFT